MHLGRLDARIDAICSAYSFHPAPNRQLYDVLAHPVIQQNRIPILLACNKIDMGLKAHSVDFIRKRLEKELDQVCGGLNGRA